MKTPYDSPRRYRRGRLTFLEVTFHPEKVTSFGSQDVLFKLLPAGYI